MNYIDNYINALNNPPIELQTTWFEEINFISKIINNFNCKSIIEFGSGLRPLPELAKKFSESDFLGIDNDKQIYLKSNELTSKLNNLNYLNQDIFHLKNKYLCDFIFSTYNLIGSVDINQRYNLIKQKSEILKDTGFIVTITWNQNDFTTNFLKHYYYSIGLKIDQINSQFTKTDKHIFYRVSPYEIINLYKQNNISSNNIMYLGDLWVGILGQKNNDLSY